MKYGYKGIAKIKKKITSTKKQQPNAIYSAKDVKKITLSKKNGFPIKLGNGSLGNVYVGTVVFNNMIRKAVAIKIFKWDYSAQSLLQFHNQNEFARNARKVISDLQQIKLPEDKRFPNRKIGATLIPKIELLKVRVEKNAYGNINIELVPENSEIGEWVVVSPLFGSKTKGSKFGINNDIIITPETIPEITFILSKVADIGYYPKHLLAGLKSAVIPIDLDLLALREKDKNPIIKAKRLLETYVSIIKSEENLSDTKLNTLKFFYEKTLENDLSPELKEKFKEEYKQFITHRYLHKSFFN